MIIKKANCLVPLFLYLWCWTWLSGEDKCVMRARLPVYCCRSASTQRTSWPTLHSSTSSLLSARAIQTDRVGCGSLLCTENFNPGNFITSSRHNTTSYSAELADSRPDDTRVKQKWAELKATFQWAVQNSRIFKVTQELWITTLTCAEETHHHNQALSLHRHQL